MRIYIDITEPGSLAQLIRAHSEKAGISVERTILRKRTGTGAALRGRRPFYGGGVDFLIVDDGGVPLAAIERKSLDDLARSLGHGAHDEGPRLFRQVKDLQRYPFPILLLEGAATPVFRRLEPAVLGFQFCSAREGIAIVYSSSPETSAHAVGLFARKLQANPTWTEVEHLFAQTSDGPQGPRDPAA